MTREEAIHEIEKVFEPAFANYIITALTEGATSSDKERQPCEDCISREAVVNWLEFCTDDSIEHSIESNLEFIPSVTPQPKIGKWEYVQYDYNPDIGNWHCSECRGICTEMHSIKDAYNYCPNCGAKMEVSE